MGYDPTLDWDAVLISAIISLITGPACCSVRIASRNASFIKNMSRVKSAMPATRTAIMAVEIRTSMMEKPFLLPPRLRFLYFSDLIGQSGACLPAGKDLDPRVKPEDDREYKPEDDRKYKPEDDREYKPEDD